MNSEVYTMNKEYRLGVSSFSEFAKMQEFIKKTEAKHIVVDCTRTSYISPAFSTLFGSLPHYGMFYNKQVSISYDRNVCKRYILDMGILRYYGKTDKYHKKAVPFTAINWEEYEKESINGIRRIIEQLPKLSPNVEGVMYSQIGEIFNNAKDHSNYKKDKNISVYCCGHHNAEHDRYIVSIYDTGVGIAENVSDYLKEDVDDIQAVLWAFGDGNSTQNTADIPRGIGLNALANFIKANSAKLYVCSGEALYIVSDRMNVVKKIDGKIKGTLYVIDIKIDPEHIYVI